MKRIFLILGLMAVISLSADVRAVSPSAKPVKAEIFDVSGLPVRLREAVFDTVEFRADFNYSVTNLTDRGIWNFEVVLYFLDAKSEEITKKIEICTEFLIDENHRERCRYMPPGVLIKPRKTENVGVNVNERVEPGTKVVAAIREVRGDEGIWRIDDEKLKSAIQLRAQGKPYLPLDITKKNHIVLTEADKLNVIEPALEKALLEKQIPDYGLLKDEKNVVLSTENIPNGFAPRIAGVNLILLTPEKIQEKADSEGDFTYLSFDEIKANGDKIFVVLANSWMKGRSSEKFYMSGGGMFLEFRSENGKWIGKMVGGWIS